MDFVYNDGGRAAAGYKGQAGDCVVRAIAIATQKPYQEVYDAINALALAERARWGRRSSARSGVGERRTRATCAHSAGNVELHILQRIFSAAVTADEVSEWTAKRRATAALKIDWTKPRANDGAMGIECTWPRGTRR